ncbi:MAG: hypothetical protein CSYNP_03492 [Syntrophus sp. SKADARSKE-3]|nr:hypothetical protein [Syntrophus sp. SKADARSKE-3]
MKPFLFISLIALFIVTAQTSAIAQSTSDSLRCTGGIISIGEPASELVRKCGEPSFTAQRKQKIVEDGVFPGDRIITTIIIDDWTYNFGPNRFQYRILLRNGRVWNIETLNYGY